MSSVIARPLRIEEAASWLALRREALERAPLAFTASLESDVLRSEEDVAAELRKRDGSTILAAFGPELVGSLGLLRPRHPKARHKLYLWGLYVRPEARGRGAASGLLEAAVAHARSLSDVDWIQLAVGSVAPEARRLYERFGFVAWGREPDALRQDGASIDETHMALRVRS